MSNEDHYETLNVPRSASQRDIAKAYRALMRTHHPDVDTRTGVDPAELLSIMKAFAVLGDPVARAAYDHSFPEKSSPQDVPVRHIHTDEPPFRVSPVHWESGPRAGRHKTP
jgi:DnaJ-class molecular chaperone